MKKLIITITIIILIIAIGLVTFSIIREQNVSKVNSELKTSALKLNQQTNLREVTLKIDGMFCVSCATGIEYALKQKNGVINASVNYDSKIGRVVYNPQKISKDEIIQAVNPYTATITGDKSLK